MDLSVIIVNYNVKFFLEQCLCSVRKAIGSLNAEVLVVDNNSTDGSTSYIVEKFPFAQFIANSKNEGFAKANNLALVQAKGRHILFLNPDTIITEDCFTRCLSFIQSKPDSGAVGIRMIDGTGKFLKESKRGFPSPWVSFCKISGLTSLFPDSRSFAGYYLGNLSSEQNQQVDALSGAFMLVKKEVLDRTGGFDERFFMYAEDIDLSYRIQKAGFQNYYFAESTIIHFKGESTTKDGHYIQLFYKAMSQFVQKHYSGFSSGLLVSLMRMGIWLKAAVAKSTQKEESKKKDISGKFSFAGDKDSIMELSKWISPDPLSENLIYCVGKKFSYEQLVREVGKQQSKKSIFIYSEGSGSIVSSGSKDERGVAFAISG